MQAPIQVLIHGRSTLSHTRITHAPLNLQHPPHILRPLPHDRARAHDNAHNNARRLSNGCVALGDTCRRPRPLSVLLFSVFSFLSASFLQRSLLPLSLSLHMSVTHASLYTHLCDRPRTDDNGNHFRHTRPQPRPPAGPRPVRLHVYDDVLNYDLFYALRCIFDAVSQSNRCVSPAPALGAPISRAPLRTYDICMV